MFLVAVAQSFSDDSAISSVLLVLSMTSCLHIMGQILIQAWSLWHSKLFTMPRQVAPLKLRIRGGVKSAICNCLLQRFLNCTWSFCLKMWLLETLCRKPIKASWGNWLDSQWARETRVSDLTYDKSVPRLSGEKGQVDELNIVNSGDCWHPCYSTLGNSAILTVSWQNRSLKEKMRSMIKSVSMKYLLVLNKCIYTTE